jgi:hypothetical protein
MRMLTELRALEASTQSFDQYVADQALKVNPTPLPPTRTRWETVQCSTEVTESAGPRRAPLPVCTDVLLWGDR